MAKIENGYLDITKAIQQTRDRLAIPDKITLGGIDYKIYPPEKVLVFDDAHTAACFVPGFIERVLRDNEGGLIVPTGNTYIPVYRQVRAEKESLFPLISRVIIGNLDELWRVGRGDPNWPITYHEYTRIQLIDPLGLDEKQWIIPDSDAEDPEEEAERIELLLAAGAWALAMMGIGPDPKEGKEGSPHIGFIPKGTLPDKTMMAVSLDEATIEVNKEGAPDPDNYPTRAITQGPADIARARLHLLMATGSNKPINIRRAILEQPIPDCPASFVQLFPEITIVVDRLAARLLLEEINISNR